MALRRFRVGHIAQWAGACCADGVHAEVVFPAPPSGVSAECPSVAGLWPKELPCPLQRSTPSQYAIRRDFHIGLRIALMLPNQAAATVLGAKGARLMNTRRSRALARGDTRGGAGKYYTPTKINVPIRTR